MGSCCSGDITLLQSYLVLHYIPESIELVLTLVDFIARCSTSALTFLILSKHEFIVFKMWPIVAHWLASVSTVLIPAFSAPLSPSFHFPSGVASVVLIFREILWQVPLSMCMEDAKEKQSRLEAAATCCQGNAMLHLQRKKKVLPVDPSVTGPHGPNHTHWEFSPGFVASV